jgi:hypothetical protein
VNDFRKNLSPLVRRMGERDIFLCPEMNKQASSSAKIE